MVCTLTPLTWPKYFTFKHGGLSRQKIKRRATKGHSFTSLITFLLSFPGQTKRFVPICLASRTKQIRGWCSNAQLQSQTGGSIAMCWNRWTENELAHQQVQSPGAAVNSSGLRWAVGTWSWATLLSHAFSFLAAGWWCSLCNLRLWQQPRPAPHHLHTSLISRVQRDRVWVSTLPCLLN